MNLPDYLAPAPLDLLAIELSRHQRLEVETSPINMDFIVRCSCGEEAKTGSDKIASDIVATITARLSRWGYEHRERALERVRLVAKWGGLDNVPAAG